MTDQRQDDLGGADAAASSEGHDPLAPTLVYLDTGPNRPQTATAPVESDILDGRYELLALLGRGGMGNVYKARDLQLDETVALKTLRGEFVDNQQAVERFRAEVRLARRVTHRNVARTYDLGSAAGVPYLTMEFIDGEDLGALMHRRGRLTVQRFLELMVGVCEGLAAAHAVGVVHRDLKPQNVIVAEDGRVVVTDFGIARATREDHRLTAEGAPLGTPAYMAPEQVHGKEEADQRADIYALGIMAFEMLTGSLPFSGKTPMSTALARLLEPPPALDESRSDLPAELVDAVHRCLERDPQRRWQSVEELTGALQRLAKWTHSDALETCELRSATDARANSSRAGWLASTSIRINRDAKTVAVLPLRRRGKEACDALADGLTEELIDELSMSPGLKVRPRGAVMPYKGSDSPPREIGRALSVQVIVEGSIRRMGERVRVRVALISVEEGFQIWADRFDGTAGDLFDITETAARAVADALTVEQLATPQPAVVDSGAVELYMRARQEMRAYWFGDLSGAIDLFERALAKAPNDGRILAGAATARARSTFYRSQRRDEQLELAEQYAQRAIEAAPERAEPYLALARIHFARFEFGESLAASRRALRRAPSSAHGHHLLGIVLREIGPLDVAIRHLETAIELDPHFYTARWGLAQAYALRGDWSRADRLLDMPAEHEDHLNAREAARTRRDLWRGESRWLDEGKSRPVSPISPPIRHASEFRRQLMLTGRVSEEYLSMQKRALRDSKPGSRLNVVIGQLLTEGLTYAGRFEEALDSLESTIEAGLVDLVWLQRCPLFEELRGRPRFEACRRKLEERTRAIKALAQASV